MSWWWLSVPRDAKRAGAIRPFSLVRPAQRSPGHADRPASLAVEGNLRGEALREFRTRAHQAHVLGAFGRT